jgi:conjugal transfer pilus assembly protein TraV
MIYLFRASVLTPTVFLSFICLSLGGCSTTSETFDCQSGKGVGCKSISTVNKMVNQGSLGGEVEEGKQSLILPSSVPIMSTGSPGVEASGNTLADKTFSQQADIPLSDDFLVRRVSEEHLRVWIAPFQDVQGNFHEGSIVHTVLKPGFWQISDTAALNQAGLSQASLFQASLSQEVE